MELRISFEDPDILTGERDGRAAVMDEQSFRLLYERTARSLWAYLFHATRDRAAADDLVQESYHRFLRVNPPEMDASGQKNYLFRIATNLLRDRARSKRTYVELRDTAAPGVAGRSVEVETDLKRALTGMGEREREILWLAYAEGFSHREIADLTGVKEQSVRPLLHRAKAKLAELLRRGGFGK